MGETPCLVWLPADHRLLGAEGQQMPYVVLGDEYARAVQLGAQARLDPSACGIHGDSWRT